MKHHKLAFLTMIEKKHFEKYYHKMQETRNNCSGTKIGCTKSIFSKLKSCHCIWLCTFVLYFGSRAYLFSPDEGSCYVFSTRNNCSEFVASYGIIIQSFIQSIKRQVNFIAKTDSDI